MSKTTKGMEFRIRFVGGKDQQTNGQFVSDLLTGMTTKGYHVSVDPGAIAKLRKKENGQFDGGVEKVHCVDFTFFSYEYRKEWEKEHGVGIEGEE